MTLRIGMVTFDTTDAHALGRWWADAFDGTVVQENEGWFVVVSIGEGQPLIAFQRVDDPTPGKNRLHLDLLAGDSTAAVERLRAAGATLVAEREMPGLRWTTLADPDGNEFCVASDGSH